jgi:FCD domain
MKLSAGAGLTTAVHTAESEEMRSPPRAGAADSSERAASTKIMMTPYTAGSLNMIQVRGTNAMAQLMVNNASTPDTSAGGMASQLWNSASRKKQKANAIPENRPKISATSDCPSMNAHTAEMAWNTAVPNRRMGTIPPTAAAGTTPTNASPTHVQPTTKAGSPSIRGSLPAPMRTPVGPGRPFPGHALHAADASHNPILAMPLTAVHAVSQPRLNRLIADQLDRAEVHAQHSAIYRAIVDRKPQAAALAVRRHVAYLEVRYARLAPESRLIG